MAFRKTTKDSVPVFTVDQIKNLPSSARYIDTNALAEYLGVTRTTIWRKQDTGKFPRPYKVVGLKNYWRRKDVIEWLKAGKIGRCQPSPQALADMQGAGL
jgi:predicted DNA-binding transcriptional regulator AlpA